MNLFKDKSGQGLIILAILLALALIVVGGITAFLVNAFRITSANLASVEAFGAAQAGAYRALYDYRTGGNWSELDVSLSAEKSFKTGKDANYALIDSENVVLQSSNTQVTDFPIDNIHVSNDITITHVTVEWVTSTGRRITNIYLGGVERWSGNESSGALLDISDVTIGAGATLNDNRLVFNGDISSRTVTATFRFNDSSERSVQLYPASNKEFSVTSTGVAVKNVTVRRTIEATYDTPTGEITSWKEITEHIT